MLSSPRSSPATGSTAVVGRGGMGVVYRATDLSLDRTGRAQGARDELADDPASARRFVAESKLAASLDHPNVIPIYAAGEDDGMPLHRDALRAGRGPARASRTRRAGSSPARGARSSPRSRPRSTPRTRRGLVHRDVKPANVLLATGDHVYLTDFGLTQARRGRDEPRRRPARCVGTLDYIAPEQIRGEAIGAAHRRLRARLHDLPRCSPARSRSRRGRRGASCGRTSPSRRRGRATRRRARPARSTRWSRARWARARSDRFATGAASVGARPMHTRPPLAARAGASRRRARAAPACRRARPTAARRRRRRDWRWPRAERPVQPRRARRAARRRRRARRVRAERPLALLVYAAASRAPTSTRDARARRRRGRPWPRDPDDGPTPREIKERLGPSARGRRSSSTATATAAGDPRPRLRRASTSRSAGAPTTTSRSRGTARCRASTPSSSAVGRRLGARRRRALAQRHVRQRRAARAAAGGARRRPDRLRRDRVLFRAPADAEWHSTASIRVRPRRRSR